MDANGNPITDVLGSQVYLITPGATAPRITVHRSGYYRAAYLQDTWNVSRQFSVNYGLRYDIYKQSENLGLSPVYKNQISPRLNLAYAVTRRTTMRLSYNHLFIQPPLAQGSILGQPVVPETLNQYEANVEQQLAPGQRIKLAYYYKDIRNQIDTNILIPFTQIGAYSSVSFQRGAAHGVEIAYDLAPRNNRGLGGYLSYANSIDKPEGLQNTGSPVPPYNDHDVLNSIGTGLDYTFVTGALVGLNVYHSSGTQSSQLGGAFNGNLLSNGHRTAHTTVNLRLASPHLGSYGALELDVENLFDSRQPLNFNSGYSGTRFQQGRRVLLRLTGNL